MRLERSLQVRASRESVWSLLCDVPRVARCIDGVQSLTCVREGAYEGLVLAHVGPIPIAFEGRLELLELDSADFTGVVRGGARDTQGAAELRARLRFSLEERGAQATDLALVLDARLSGPIAELGQLLIESRLDRVLDTLAARIESALHGSASGAAELEEIPLRDG